MALTTLNKPLQDYELLILEFVAKFGVVNPRHVKCWLKQHSLDTTILDKQLSSMKRRSLINQDKVLQNGEVYLTLTDLSAKFLGEKRVAQLPLAKLNHDMLLIDLYFMYCRDYPLDDILTEYNLKKIHGIKLGDKKKIPDLLINGDIAIELELTQKSHNTLIEIISHYLLDNTLKQVIYYVKSKTLANKLLALSGEHPKLLVYIIDINPDKTLNINHHTLKLNPYLHSVDFDLDEYLKT